MTACELIDKIDDLVELYGDLPVMVRSVTGIPREVLIADENGDPVTYGHPPAMVLIR